MFKVLARLGDLLQMVEFLDDLVEIGFRIKQAEALIRAAPTGSIVPCGTIKSRAFGRHIVLPLNPIVKD